MKKYFSQSHPVRIPTTDGKLIEEHMGLASNGENAFSTARMEAPPFWSEPHQTPMFDEMTLMISGRKQIEIDGETIVLEAGQSIWIQAGARVQYSNPFPEPNSYWSVCIPAFSMEKVNREG